MLKNGFDSTYDIFVEENTQLRNCLLVLQEDLKELVESKSKLISESKSKYKEELLKEVNMKLYRLKVIQPMAFKLSLCENIKDIQAIFKENIKRVSNFLDTFINPENLFEFLDRLNEHPKLKKSVVKVRSLDELYNLIINTLSDSPEKLSTGYKIGLKPLEKVEERPTARFNQGIDSEEGIYAKAPHAENENIIDSGKVSDKT